MCGIHGFFLLFCSYTYLGISCLTPCDFAPGLSCPYPSRRLMPPHTQSAPPRATTRVWRVSIAELKKSINHLFGCISRLSYKKSEFLLTNGRVIYGSGSARMGGFRCLWRVPKVHLPLLIGFRRIIPRSGFHKHQRYRWVLSSNVWREIFRYRTCFSDRHRRGICSSGVR